MKQANAKRDAVIMADFMNNPDQTYAVLGEKYNLSTTRISAILDNEFKKRRSRK